MANGVYIAMSAAAAAGKQMDVLANNIANADTPGFKQARVTFQDFMIDTKDGRPSEKGFTAVTSTVVDGKRGRMMQTDNPLDLALESEGYFTYADQNGAPVLSRAGNLRIDEQGTLVGPTGMPILAGPSPDAATPVRVDPNGPDVMITREGEVRQAGTALAKLAIVTVAPDLLQPRGDATFAVADPQALAAADAPAIATGALEGSNMNPVRGMIALIEVTQNQVRAQRLLSQYRRMDQKTLEAAR